MGLEERADIVIGLFRNLFAVKKGTVHYSGPVIFLGREAPWVSKNEPTS